MSMQSILDNVPDYKVFLTVDELDAALIQLGKDYPDKVTVTQVGTSRKGNPMLCAKIGNGSKAALFYGCPHPNEPIGAMMSHYWARAIAEDDEYREKLDYTFYIMPVSDVDGTKLNEKWFKGPFNLHNYARNFYRPASYEQVEWTFPMDYKSYKFDAPIPETQALMKIIDEVKPEFIYSLHNAGFGGTFWYVSNPQPQSVYDALYASSEKAGVPLDLGEPEMPFAVQFAPAFYKMPTAKDMYDYFEEFTPGDPAEKMTSGECSGAYAGEGTVQLVAELPYFYEERVNSEKIMDFTRAAAIEQKLDGQQEHIEMLKSFFDRASGFYTEGNSFANTVGDYVKIMMGGIEGERAFVKSSEQFNSPCKESEAFSNLHMMRFYQLLNWGSMIRSTEHELEAGAQGEAKKQLEAIKAEAEAVLRQKADELEAELNYSVIDIRKLVQVQLESALQILEQM